MKNFGLLGAGGYIAPRHMKAIKETGNTLCVAADISDSVGIIDSYFPEASFFTEIERFDRHIDKLRGGSNKLDYLSVCTPNYLHDSHVRLGLRNGCDVICEKPLVINYKNLQYLEKLEQETKKKVYCILQLRLHQDIINLKKMVEDSPPDHKFKVDLRYITSRGVWYNYSWKAQDHLSGGILANIGIHFFDMLMWVFGKALDSNVSWSSPNTVQGVLSLERADVDWFLSCNYSDLPIGAKKEGKRTFRRITIDEEDLEFSGGFGDLHTKSYKEILDGKGYGIEDVKPSINLITELRHGLQS